jgi:hypothetical protein
MIMMMLDDDDHHQVLDDLAMITMVHDNRDHSDEMNKGHCHLTVMVMIIVIVLIMIATTMMMMVEDFDYVDAYDDSDWRNWRKHTDTLILPTP